LVVAYAYAAQYPNEVERIVFCWTLFYLASVIGRHAIIVVVSFMRLLGDTTEWSQGRSNKGEVVIAVSHRVILKNKLTRKWSIRVERHRSGFIEILVV